MSVDRRVYIRRQRFGDAADSRAKESTTIGRSIWAWTTAERNRFRVGIGLIAAVGLVWRVVYARWYGDVPILSDGFHYMASATSIADGHWFRHPFISVDGIPVPDAKHPPVWTLALAAVAATGRRAPQDFQLLAAVVGTATVVVTGLAGRAAFGRRVGLIAAGLACAYPNVWLYERELVSEPMALLGVATTTWLAYRFRASPGILGAVALGVVVGLCALTRPELLLLAVLVVAPVVLAARVVARRTRLVWLAAAAGACALVIAPWFVFNLTRFAEPVPLTVGLGGTMAAGNCDPTYEGELLGYFSPACYLFVGELDPDPSVADRQLRQIATTYIEAHQARFVVVSAARVGRTFNVYAPFQQRDLEGLRGTTPWVLTAGLWSYWLMIPLAIGGAVAARRRSIPLYPLLAPFVIVVVAVLPTIGAVRYRSIAEVSLVVLAATGIDASLRWWRARRGAEPPVTIDLDAPAGSVDAAPSPVAASG